jgi:hypothetical protein
VSTDCAYSVPSNQHTWRPQAQRAYWISPYLKIYASTVIEALHKLSFDHLPVILELGDEKNTPKAIILFFTNWDKYAELLKTILPPCSSLPSIPALLDTAVALFESALNMARTTAMTTREGTYHPHLLPDKLKAFICQSRRLIQMAMWSQSAEGKLALNRLHRCTKMAYFNNKWETKPHRISESGNSSCSPFFWKFIKKIKIGNLHHYRLFVKEI